MTTQSTAACLKRTFPWPTSRSASAREWAVRLLDTEADAATALARLALGAVLLPHGAQHLLGWFGGYGFAGTHAWMTGALSIPGPIAAFGIVFELIGPLLLLAGAGGRLVASGLSLFMAVAASTHWANGFFMNWVGSQAGEGYEYHLLAIALGLVVTLRGSGAASVDRVLARRLSASSER